MDKLQMNKWLKIDCLTGVFLVGLTIFLLQGDSRTVLTWWLAIGVLGLGFMPLTSLLFSGFQDKGWIFSKILAIAISGYVLWVLVVWKAVKFTSMACIGVTFICIAANGLLAVVQKRKNSCILPIKAANLIFWEEVIFYLAFLLWTYEAGFRPQAHGTEKFMDYGFMEVMMRSMELPAQDIWYGLKPINYYYGGQYYAVYLTKLTGTKVAVTYNLMRMMIAGMAFALPFSLVRQIAEDYYGKLRQKLCVWSGLLAGAAVSLAGNMHYVLYGKLFPLLWITPDDEYWFPDSTRFIGHNPPTADETIHEFPSYSFLLGDLHAHVVNIIFVLTVTGLLYAWITREKYDRKSAFLQWPLLMCGFFVGIFQWTNAWDFAIYYVVSCGICLFGNLARFEDWKEGFISSVIQWIEMIGLGFLVALPFTLQFDSSMAQGVVLAKNHSAFYQLCVLWALPVGVCLVYLVKLFLEQGKQRLLKWLCSLKKQDIFIAVLCMCAIGLVAMPEVVYLKDIYEETAARSNTMFKLTYQAFILFGISMGFILIRFLTETTHRWARKVGFWGLICVLMTTGYTVTGAVQWSGEIWKRENYKGLDATAFLESHYPEDALAIRWLKDNIEGTPIVLEANGDSYTDYCRVSAMTGLPTVLGWYVHEWLWRMDTDDLNEKNAQIESIYTSTDEEQVRSLLKEFQVAYIFVGQMEREKYPALNESLLKSLGTVVFDGDSYIIQVD